MEGLKKERETIISEVFEMLKQHPETRNSDKYLWLKIIKKRGFCGSDIETVLFSGKVPDFATISRYRRKIQQSFPELRGSNKITEHRMLNEMYWESFGKAKGLLV